MDVQKEARLLQQKMSTGRNALQTKYIVYLEQIANTWSGKIMICGPWYKNLECIFQIFQLLMNPKPQSVLYLLYRWKIHSFVPLAKSPTILLSRLE